MLLGRNSELKYLNNYYDKDGSQILVLYGQKDVGKTELIKEFILDKPNSYYFARSCSETEQIEQWKAQLVYENKDVTGIASYTDILSSISLVANDKKIIVIDEFQNMVKSGDSFMNELVSYIKENEDRKILVILLSSSIGWVENSMITKIGTAAYSLSGFLKLKELTFDNLVRRFPNFRIEECIEAYSILGGFPGLWNQFDDRLTIQQNVCRHILEKKSMLFSEGERMVAEQLRETGVYNTILSAIASGKHKLNDLYLYTGYSRAKISVYIKNLIELELVEKVFSYDTDGRDNAQKGVYRISHPIVDFYYTFLYPNASDLQMLSPDAFYVKHIATGLKEYVGFYFKKVCRQHMDKWNQHNKLPIKVESIGEWIGKVGELDIIAQDENANTIVGICNWKKPMMTYEDYEQLIQFAKKAKIMTDYIYMYNVARFDEKLSLEAKVKKNIKLISVSDL